MLTYYYIPKGSNVRLSPNFTSNEFDCKGNMESYPQAQDTLIAIKLIEVLQKVRNRIQRPLRITSAYRPYEYNRAIGSNDASQHPKGTAADVTCKGLPASDLAGIVHQVLDEMHITGGVGVYPFENFVHVDVREGNRRARW